MGAPNHTLTLFCAKYYWFGLRVTSNYKKWGWFWPKSAKNDISLFPWQPKKFKRSTFFLNEICDSSHQDLHFGILHVQKPSIFTLQICILFEKNMTYMVAPQWVFQDRARFNRFRRRSRGTVTIPNIQNVPNVYRIIYNPICIHLWKKIIVFLRFIVVKIENIANF